jgi:hypothetical protein
LPSAWFFRSRLASLLGVPLRRNISTLWVCVFNTAASSGSPDRHRSGFTYRHRHRDSSYRYVATSPVSLFISASTTAASSRSGHRRRPCSARLHWHRCSAYHYVTHQQLVGLHLRHGCPEPQSSPPSAWLLTSRSASSLGVPLRQNISKLADLRLLHSCLEPQRSSPPLWLFTSRLASLLGIPLRRNTRTVSIGIYYGCLELQQSPSA